LSAEVRSFGGRYHVIERVGVGGMAEVYRARDELLGREVAVKVLSERFSRDQAFVERFRREAQSAANLNHPNIVSLFDFGADGDTYYIVMEFIDGRPLSDIIKAEGPLMPERSAEIAADVARALSRAHAAGLVHRDIKPGNIMITSQGQTKVTDFGIARALSPDGDATVTQTGMVIGTASYLSPEQAQGNPIDQRTDVYSLGCVLYEMLTSRAPFSGETPLAIAYKHVRENPSAPSSVNRDSPAALDSVVLKAMAKNPDNRYSSANEMAEDLDRFLGGQKVHATPILADQTVVAERATGTQILQETDYGPDRKSAAWYVVVALAILAVLGGLAWFLATSLFGPEVEVPNVVGMRAEQATRILEDAGFVVAEDEGVSGRRVGVVFDQDPDGESMAAEGSEVTIFVSTGRRQVVVPDLEGMTIEEAEDALREVDLRLGDINDEPSEDIEADLITRSEPPADEEVDANSEVDVFVSTGEETTSVPFVTGQTQEAAEAEIEAAGLVPEVTTAPSDEDEGIVIAQDPEGGVEAEPGDTVRITVSEGPSEEPMPNVIGENADEAEAFLEQDFGLNVEQVPEPCAGEPPGNVCRQEPEEGTPVSPGDDATLYVQPGDASLGDGWIFALTGWLTLLIA
jgi:eukaryotic-like serine/threonine-protein kinase